MVVTRSWSGISVGPGCIKVPSKAPGRVVVGCAARFAQSMDLVDEVVDLGRDLNERSGRVSSIFRLFLLVLTISIDRGVVRCASASESVSDPKVTKF
jgi:hypothetical protein